MKKYLMMTAMLLTCSVILLPTYADGFGIAGNTNSTNAGNLRQNQINSLLANASAGKTANQTRGQAVAQQPSAQRQAQNLRKQASNASLSDQAFANTVRNLMPLSPQQIKTLRYMFDQSQRAAAAYPGAPPKPTSSSLIINLSPGATPPIIRLRAGYITSLVFLDATGAPWPIKAEDLGNPKAFNVVWDKKSNTLLVQALSPYENGNLAVMLRGLDTPVMLTLMPGQSAVDYRVDLRVPRIGPNANPVMDGLPQAANEILLNVLDGIPPHGSKTLLLQGAEGQAWLLGNHIFLRTSLTLLSPAWVATMNSSDGTHAYELPATPVMLGMQRGKIIKLMVKGL